MAVYVVSDLHGYNQLFREGLKKIKFKDTDRLYVLCDCIYRGPDGIDILETIRHSDNMDLIIGNHEFMMLQSLREDGGKDIVNNRFDNAILWLDYNGGTVTYKRYCDMEEKARKDLINWMKKRPCIQTLEVNGINYCLLHSCYRPEFENVPFSEIPYVEAYRLVWYSMFRDDTFCENNYKEYELTFITGHVPVQKILYEKTGRVDKAQFSSYREENFYNIDGGCAFGPQDEFANGAIFLRLDDRKEFCISFQE